MKHPFRPVVAACVALLVVASPAWGSNDPGRPQQWALDRIHAEQAWSKATGAGITIAIVDTGIDLGHPDLKAKIAGHYDCTSGSCVTGSGVGNDDNGHGSHVAGIAAASTNNGIGVAGTAPGAKLMAVKVLDSNGKGTCANIVTGIRFAADHAARVINLSLGPDTNLFTLLLGNSCVTDLQNAAQYAYDKGAVVVIAAGNTGAQSLYDSPALEVVGATGPNDEPASYSSTGANVYAPGGNVSDPTQCTSSGCILSTYKDNQYAVLEGTSMATPFVSGLAALLLSEGYTNAQAVARINATADTVNGIRRINVARAVGATAKPSPSPTHSAARAPTPVATHHTTTRASTTAAPKPTKPAARATLSPRVLAVGPTVAPTPGIEAVTAPAAGTTDRAPGITAAAVALLLVIGLTARVIARRARRT